MAKSKLIKDTTRAEREEIIKLALAGCGNGSCDNCGSCSLGAGNPYGTYQPYIDGEMEIADINMMVAERNAKLFGLQRGYKTKAPPGLVGTAGRAGSYGQQT